MTLTSSTDTQPAAEAPAAGSPRARRVARRVAARLLSAAGTLLGAATVAFLAQAALPGDRATAIYNLRAGISEARTAEELAGINATYGLDRPLLAQYLDYLAHLVRGDLGLSYQQFRPVTDIIGEQIGPTVALALTAIALSWVISVLWVGLTAGRPRHVRAVGSVVDTVAAGLPHYWLGIILLLVFALHLGWFPVMGGVGARGLLLPALTLAIPLAGFMSQAMRTEFERSLAQPFVVSARMRGMGDLGVRLRHVLRHAVLPAVSLSGWALGATLSGSVLVEQIFTRPGIGRVLVTSVNNQDMPIVTGVVVLVAVIYVAANLLVDVVYTIVDPRLEVR